MAVDNSQARDGDSDQGESFFARTRAANKIMVLDLGFVGDTVHLLPALWMVRQSYPRAELHVAVSSHVTSLMECVPWVDRVWGYMRYPRHATLRENLQMVSRLRKEKFDALINLNGSDRSSWLTFISGARERLGPMPKGGASWFRRRVFTAFTGCASSSEPGYVRRCRSLEQAGFPFVHPEFHVQVSPAHLHAAGIPETQAGTYFHLSPFTTCEDRELPPAQLVQFMAAMSRNFVGKRWVLSGAPTERERKKMAELLQLLPHKPWRVFADGLSLAQLAAVIKFSALHFCGNSGPLHLAVMTQTPTVAWIGPHPDLRAWMPEGEKYRVLLGRRQPGTPFLCGISTEDLLAQAQALLNPGVPSLEPSDPR
jgi:ADP-heptose:LPS heptosyltransferase